MTGQSFREMRLFALCCCLLVLLAACGPQSSSATSGGQTTEIPQGSTRVPTVTARQGTSGTRVAAQTSCPPAGTARAAVMPSLQVGRHANIIYTFESYSPYQYQGSTTQDVTSFLKRYDVTTGVKTVIATLPHSRIDASSASISPDGQWIVFETHTDLHPFSNGAFIPMLELVRIDGHYMQTLFCGSTRIPVTGYLQGYTPGTSWSQDQKQLLFNIFPGPPLNLLNIRSGSLQVLVSSVYFGLSPSRWLDTTGVLVANYPGPPGSPGLLVLNTSKGPDQQETSLQTILTPSICGNYALSPDATQLYVAHCTYTNAGGDTGPSSVSVQSLSGGTPHTIFTSQQLALCTIELISGASLLLDVCNWIGNTSQDGWWKINADGTGLTRLQIGNFGLPALAPDGNTYVIGNLTQGEASLLIGTLTGGTPKTFATTPTTDGEVAVVGWATM